MLDCMILGDSIAVGVAMHKPQCAVYAKVGITSHSWNKKYLKSISSSRVTLISLGSNDFNEGTTFDSILKLREAVSSEKVFWVIPAIKPNIQEIVDIVAARYEDEVIYIRSTSDGVHPTAKEYKRIASEIK